MTDERRRNTFDEMIEVIEATKRGELTQRRRVFNSGCGWIAGVIMGSFDFENYQYRVASRKPSVDWSHVADWIWAIARNKDGRSYGYDCEPIFSRNHNCWGAAGRMTSMDAVASYDPGTCDWTESLIIRPGYKQVTREKWGAEHFGAAISAAVEELNDEIIPSRPTGKRPAKARRKG